MNLLEALKQARDELCNQRDAFYSRDYPIELREAISNVKAAIEQLEKVEPVGEVYRYGKDSHGREWHGIHWYDPNLDMPTGTKLYTHPAAPGEKK